MKAQALQNAMETVPSHNHLKFYDSKRHYPKLVADFLEFQREDISKIAGVPKLRVRWDDQIPKEVRQRMMEIGNICELVAGYYEGDSQKTAIWFQTPNPLLGNVAPRDMIRLGRYKVVLKIVQSALSGIRP